MKNDAIQQKVINETTPSLVKTSFASRSGRFLIGWVVLSIGLVAVFYALLNNNSESNKSIVPEYPTAVTSEEIKKQAVDRAIAEIVADEMNKPAVNSSAWTKEERASRKKEGVSIGMTKEEVLASIWGKPKEINRSRTAYGTSEQWVYRGRSYLYFDDDILTSIQN